MLLSLFFKTSKKFLPLFSLLFLKFLLFTSSRGLQFVLFGPLGPHFPFQLILTLITRSETISNLHKKWLGSKNLIVCFSCALKLMVPGTRASVMFVYKCTVVMYNIVTDPAIGKIAIVCQQCIMHVSRHNLFSNITQCLFGFNLLTLHKHDALLSISINKNSEFLFTTMTVSNINQLYLRKSLSWADLQASIESSPQYPASL